MVLQQGRDIHIWGKADPGEEIAVTLAGKTRSTLPDANGNWSVHLPAMSAGGPFIVMVRGRTTVVLKDVMIGEVWVASGQSNMAFSLLPLGGRYAPPKPSKTFPQ
jgi:sialate O-acetylesterase